MARRGRGGGAGLGGVREPSEPLVLSKEAEGAQCTRSRVPSQVLSPESGTNSKVGKKQEPGRPLPVAFRQLSKWDCCVPGWFGAGAEMDLVKADPKCGGALYTAH